MEGLLSTGPTPSSLKLKSLVKSVWYSTYLSRIRIFQNSVTFEGMRAPAPGGAIVSCGRAVLTPGGGIATCVRDVLTPGVL